MNKINIQKGYAVIGILGAIVFSTLFVANIFADEKGRFERGAYNNEVKEAIYKAFNENDHEAYVEAVSTFEGKRVLTEEQFDAQMEKIVRRKSISETFEDNDYQRYLNLTEESSRQLSQDAFEKKVQYVSIKNELKEALENRDYDTFLAKKEELKELKGDRVNRKDKEITEEKFNELADKVEAGDKLFKKWDRGHKEGKLRKYKR